MRIVRKTGGQDRLVDLERTMDSMNGQLREIQGELNRFKTEPLSVRVWRNLVNLNSKQEFMSAVCNRRVRPNTKIMVSHDDPRA